ncbi:helix-turn-helix domain-containing protein [Streptomyces sp. NPDC050485]|uniref:helix-turn-helix domain-containing protein n=1 Tax=Streptomyces sp. NPDC050485 TaxID=3365617 RepID=UPI0037A65499
MDVHRNTLRNRLQRVQQALEHDVDQDLAAPHAPPPALSPQPQRPTPPRNGPGRSAGAAASRLNSGRGELRDQPRRALADAPHSFHGALSRPDRSA